MEPSSLISRLLVERRVCLEAFWRLISQLDAVLQEGDGQPLFQGRRWLSRKEQPAQRLLVTIHCF